MEKPLVSLSLQAARLGEAVGINRCETEELQSAISPTWLARGKR